MNRNTSRPRRQIARVLCAALATVWLAGAARAVPLPMPPAAPAAPATAPADTPGIWADGIARDVLARPPDANRCNVLYAAGDQRLFDFVKTRQAVDIARYQGMNIRSISFLTLPIFNPDDPHESNRLYRFVNRLHIPTKHSPIRKQILFREGEPLDERVVHESERTLRGAQYLYDALVVPAQTCGHDIDLLVVVRDIWTLQPTVNFKRSGGQNSTGIGISDENILGYGHSLNLAYTRNPERSGVILAYENKNLLDGHTALNLDYTKNSDGRVDAVSLVRPFYALDTRWSAGGSTEDDTRHETIVTNGVTTNEYDHRAQKFEAFYGISPGLRNHYARRVRFGFTKEMDSFYKQVPGYLDPIPADRVLAYPWVEFEAIEDNFWTTSNYAQMFRNEDIQVGSSWVVRGGVAGSASGSTEDAWITKVTYQHTLSFAGNHLVQGRASADTYWNSSTQQLDNSLFSYEGQYDRFLDERNRWHVLLQLDAGANLTQDKELTAGGESHLRGYPNHWQRGDRRVIVNVERRHYYNVHVLNLFRLGAAAFVDVGQAWDTTHAIVQSDHTLADIGIGLRVNSSKARANHVMHMNLAFPLVDRAGAGDFQWSVYAEQQF